MNLPGLEMKREGGAILVHGVFQSFQRIPAFPVDFAACERVAVFHLKAGEAAKKPPILYFEARVPDVFDIVCCVLPLPVERKWLV